MTESAFVVTRPTPGSGLGANLTSLAGAARAASALERSLLVDWRGMAELRDKSLNYFTTVYEPLDEVYGAPVCFAGAPDIFDYTALEESQRPLLTPGEMSRLLAAGSRRPEPYLVMQQWHGVERIVLNRSSRYVDQHYAELMRQLRPVERISTAVESFAEREFGGRFVVAVNIRTGNGQFKPGSGFEHRIDQTIFSDERRFLDNVLGACRERAARGRSRDHARIFVVTDCDWMHDLLMSLPDAVARRTTFPPPGVGHGFADFASPEYTDLDSVCDTVTDMHLMARCNAFVYNKSAYNLYPRLVTDGFGGNMEHIDRRFQSRWSRLKRASRLTGREAIARLKELGAPAGGWSDRSRRAAGR